MSNSRDTGPATFPMLGERDRMNLTGQPAFVGRHCGSNEYDVEAGLTSFYADALGEHVDRARAYAPPLLFHSECYEFLGEWYLKNLFGNLHAQQDWWMFAPIEIGTRIRTRSTIIDRFHKRGRDYVVNETDYVNASDGRLLVRGRTFQSFLPPKETESDSGFVVDSDTAARKKLRAPFPTATGPDLASVEKHIDKRRCWMFSGPAANYHTDREAAQKLGFPTIVVQGMMSTCFVSEVMERHFGEGWLRGGHMSVKLTNVLWVDETVKTHARIRDEVSEGTQTRIVCDVWVDKDDGTRVLLGEASAIGT